MKILWKELDLIIYPAQNTGKLKHNTSTNLPVANLQDRPLLG